jgi:hypothetical protein
MKKLSRPHPAILQDSKAECIPLDQPHSPGTTVPVSSNLHMQRARSKEDLARTSILLRRSANSYTEVQADSRISPHKLKDAALLFAALHL